MLYEYTLWILFASSHEVSVLKHGAPGVVWNLQYLALVIHKQANCKA